MWELYAFGLSCRVDRVAWAITAASFANQLYDHRYGRAGMRPGWHGHRKLWQSKSGQIFPDDLCGLLSVISVVYGAPAWILILFLIIWGIAVVGDSPQLSSLNAQSAPRNIVGSALTATTCIGFSITVASLLLLDWIAVHTQPRLLFLILAIGPMIGVGAYDPTKD